PGGAAGGGLGPSPPPPPAPPAAPASVSGGPDPADRRPAAHPRANRRSTKEIRPMTVPGSATDGLVDADWAKAHLDDPSVRFVEVDVATTAYEQSHLPGPVGWNWTS